MAGITESLQAIQSSDAFRGLQAVAGPLTSVAGTLTKYRGAKDAGKAAFQASQFEAEQLRQNATQEQAAAQRKAAEERRKGRFIQSRAMAVAGASGAGVTDPTVVDVLSDLEAEEMFRSSLALFSGDERARQLRTAANARAYTGASTQRAYNQAARSSLFSGMSLFSKYAPVTRDYDLDV